MVLAQDGGEKMIISTAEQGSQEWISDRLGVVTASKAYNVIKKGRGGKGYAATRETYMMELVAEVCTGQSPEIKGKALDWGNENEPFAREAYEAKTFSVVDEVGLIYKDESKRFGASPDGLVSDDGGIEIKCPFTTPVHLDTMINGTIKPEYICQMQFIMWVTGRLWIDFCSFDPRMIGNADKRLCVIRVDRDDKMMEEFDVEMPKFVNEMDLALESIGVEFGRQWEC